MYLLGVDVGTTSIKAAVYNEQGEAVSSKSIDYTLITKGEFIEFEALAYWELFQEVVKNTVGDLEIAAMSIDTQGETLVLADENSNPVRNAIVWLDNRATAQAMEIEQIFGEKKVYEVTGQPEIIATWPACKLLWVKKNEPEVWAKTKKIFLLEDYLIYKLTGKFATEKTLQSSTIYFDIRSGDWWQEMLDFVGISKDMLPTIYNSGDLIGYADKTAVAAGALDQIAAAIGAGVIKRGIISEMTGTTMVVFVTTNEIPPYNPNSKVPCHYNAIDGTYCLLSWTPTAGMALKWFKNNLCENYSFKELDELAKNVPVGSEGLIFLPYLCGSTMPNYNPEAKGTFFGLTLKTTRAHFVRSILEAVACMLRSNLDYLGIECEEIRLMGGGAESHLWCQIKADMTRKRLVTLKNNEVACLGSAILAGVSIGVFSSIEEACEKIIKTDREYNPGEDDYTKIYKDYCKLDKILNVEGGLL